MFDKYVYEKSQREISKINDIDELYLAEDINSQIFIFDINEIFNDETKYSKSDNFSAESLTYNSDDFFNNVNLENFNKKLFLNH